MQKNQARPHFEREKQGLSIESPVVQRCTTKLLNTKKLLISPDFSSLIAEGKNEAEGNAGKTKHGLGCPLPEEGETDGSVVAFAWSKRWLVLGKYL